MYTLHVIDVRLRCSLMEQVKQARCKAVIGILNAAQSKQLSKWRQLVRLIISVLQSTSVHIILL